MVSQKWKWVTVPGVDLESAPPESLGVDSAS